MDSLENHGIIIRELRRLADLSIQQASAKLQKSAGWLCEIENGSGRCGLTTPEFERIVLLLDGTQHRPMFRTWVANHKNLERFDNTFDGAVLRFIRKGLTLSAAAQKVGVSVGYLSKLESGLKPVQLTMRNRMMIAYGYSPSSFKNLATDPLRSQAVPKAFKFQILKRILSPTSLDSFYSELIANKLKEDKCTQY